MLIHDSSVYYTLVTLLHRPFVEVGHPDERQDEGCLLGQTGLQQFSPNIVHVSWQRCEEAAKGATDILTRYRQTFSLARAPYLIVSAAQLALANANSRTRPTSRLPSTCAWLLSEDLGRSRHACWESAWKGFAKTPQRIPA